MQPIQYISNCLSDTQNSIHCNSHTITCNRERKHKYFSILRDLNCTSFFMLISQRSYQGVQVLCSVQENSQAKTKMTSLQKIHCLRTKDFVIPTITLSNADDTASKQKQTFAFNITLRNALCFDDNFHQQ